MGRRADRSGVVRKPEQRSFCWLARRLLHTLAPLALTALYGCTSPAASNARPAAATGAQRWNLNAPPVSLPVYASLQASDTYGWQILTFLPTPWASEVVIHWGGRPPVRKQLPAGTPISYSYAGNFGGDVLLVTNISDPSGATLRVGRFGLDGEPTQRIPAGGGGSTLAQYESAGFSAPPGAMLLDVRTTSIGSVLFAVMIGNQEPSMVALNTDPGALPTTYKDLPNFTPVRGSAYRRQEDGGGRKVLVINLSIIPDALRVELHPI